MVAKIITGKSIRGALHYNESKVAEGEATLILASGFAGDIERLSFQQKLKRFENLTQLKPSVKTNALHISLNFDASEKLDNLKMQQIALAYMEKIGFGDQPFLVYRHHDAAHMHVHLVTTNIRKEGTRIDLHNIGRKLSEPARKAIEKEFNLIKAESIRFKHLPGIKPADPVKAQYGHIPTKRAISNVVNAVIRTYSFTSLAELNAILKQFNVTANRGREDTEMFRKKGLIYSLLNREGEKVGIPIKSSSLYSKPTLPNLEKKFEQHKERRKPYKEDLKARIDKVFNKYEQTTSATFTFELQKQQIQPIFRQNEQGFTYGVTFVDHKNKTVFNGSALGKAYGAKALTERFAHTDQQKKTEQKTYLKPRPQTRYLKQPRAPKIYFRPIQPPAFLNALLSKSKSNHGPDIPHKKKKKKQQPQQDQHLAR